MKSHHKLLVGLFLGIFFGLMGHNLANPELISAVSKNLFEPIGQLFLRLVFMIVVPMVFCGLVVGVFQLARHQDLGSVARRTLLYTVLASTLSVLIGIAAVNLTRPGVGVPIQPGATESSAAAVDKIRTNVQQSKPIMTALVEIVPKNPLDSAVRALDGEMLSLMFFALIFGVALTRLGAREGGEATLIGILEQIYDACMVLVSWAMKLAPVAVFSLVFVTTSKFGHQLLLSLSLYVATVVGALLIQQFGVYALLLKFIAKTSPMEFFKNCREVYLYAFATASSNATLPRSLEVAEHKLKLPHNISRFVLTVGSTANQNGTALFEGITVLFLAQVYGVDLNFTQQVQVVLMSILAGIGTAGVPGGSLPLIMILLQQVGIPAEGIGLILGVDRFLDMCRTTINVSGDLVIAALVSKKGTA